MSVHRLKLEDGVWGLECVDLSKCPKVLAESPIDDPCRCPDGGCARCLAGDHVHCEWGHEVDEMGPLCLTIETDECYVQQALDCLGWDGFTCLPGVPLVARVFGQDDPITLSLS